jgi:drug/metabolite transporter (DMT)-like permease
VFVWGFTAVLGALISISAYELVWYRMLIASISLWLYDSYFAREKLTLSAKKQLKLMLIGVVVAIHWFFFYHSIKNSTISVALVCLSATALFTSFLNPIFKKGVKISLVDLFTGLVMIVGISLIFHFEGQYWEGILFGLIAALSAAIFTILNEIEVQGIPASTIGKFEMLGGFVSLSLYLLLTSSKHDYQFSLAQSDLIYLLLLGTVCTAFAYVMGVAVMRELSAFTVVLITNLEPVYGILLAFVIFGKQELMSAGFYQGALLILASVFLYPIVKKFFNKR